MFPRDGSRAGRIRVAADIVVDRLPKTTGTDRVVATEYLHFRVEQEQIDCRQKQRYQDY